MADASEASRASRSDGRDDVVDDPAVGWFRDPTKHHEHRYRGESGWTRRVSNFGVPGEDPYWAPPAWYRDPSRRFQHRYWDGDGWTARAVTRGVATAAPVDAVWAPPLPHQGRHDITVVEVSSTVWSQNGSGRRVAPLRVRHALGVVPAGVGGLWPGAPWGRRWS